MNPLSQKNQSTIFGNFNGNALTAMRLMDKVRERLLWQDGLLQQSIKYSKSPDVSIIKDIIDFHTDNPAMIVGCLGQELTNEILKFKP